MTRAGSVPPPVPRPIDGTAVIASRLVTSCSIAALLLALGAIYVARAVVAPIAMALFVIALLWPLQSWLQSRIPRQLALLVSLVAALSAVVVLSMVLVWGFGGITRWTIENMGRLQSVYDQVAGWLESHGAPLSGLSLAHLDAAWTLGLLQRITGQVNTTARFWLVVFVYLILGLIEVDAAVKRVQALPNQAVARIILQGSAKTGAKLRKFMLVRTAMSVTTGMAVWATASGFGLPLAREWGLIAFSLNYLPVIGPCLATLLPTGLALTQLESWKAVVGLFLCLAALQFLIGNYLEPRTSGSALAMSPFVVLSSIFLWTWMWGLIGTFLGVPIAIAVLTFCGESSSGRWVPILLGSDARDVQREAQRSDRVSLQPALGRSRI